MLIYTLILPVGNISAPVFSELVSTAPVGRYYQIFTPLLSILAYIGLRSITVGLASGRRVALALIVSLFCVHQVTISQNTYASTFYPFARNGFIGDVIGAAEHIRQTGVRGSDVVIARATGTGLEAVDVTRENMGGYQLHSFHFAIISGHNRTNCTGYNLENPNLFCSSLTGSRRIDPSALPLGGRAEFVVLIGPDEGSIPGFAPTYRNSNVAVYRRS
jgi:hypothetical protein